MMKNKAYINEIFESIQGEGPYIGVNQLFVRFSSCNLKCKYCDTDFKTNSREYSVSELQDIINTSKNIHSVSLTGGEPLLNIDFLKELLPKVNKRIYLETNGTLYENFSEIVDLVDIVSTDIKLPSATGNKNTFKEHQKFIDIAVNHKKEIFLKVVFDENITRYEINQFINIAKKYNLVIVLQPKTDKNKLSVNLEFINKIYYKLISQYENVRLIPQVHKFLNVK